VAEEQIHHLQPIGQSAREADTDTGKAAT